MSIAPAVGTDARSAVTCSSSCSGDVQTLQVRSCDSNTAFAAAGRTMAPPTRLAQASAGSLSAAQDPGSPSETAMSASEHTRDQVCMMRS